MENSSRKIKKPWPTKDAMAQIYENNLWGTDGSDFYSGEGSHDPSIVRPYINKLVKFLSSFENPITVCDLGCGDFNIGKELVTYTKQYIAVDIVKDLIIRNKEKFQQNHLEFYCLDIARDELPKADCAIIRQVFQHVSNEEIQSTLSKLLAYQYLIVTEHIPEGNFEPNIDIISGQGIRLKKKSGVDLLAPPFILPTKKKECLLTIPLDSYQGVLQTNLYQMY
ncbi:class I SAM-dependent methyltransferase [Aquimarina litoralis]|uniref:class I SAM-dependent methyltransferase n=1 Tax=Aquimarina litoralis TaxID=584605 RepID=UPI001C577D48|nr:class I SAM-dependent methyltransferase [Aquimarina litoralis]MBW1296981.1 methyltransferase domain-containing protein [Aquimarina litoralis]